MSPCNASTAVAPGSVNIAFNSTSTSAYPVIVTTGGVLSVVQVPQFGLFSSVRTEELLTKLEGSALKFKTHQSLRSWLKA